MIQHFLFLSFSAHQKHQHGNERCNRKRAHERGKKTKCSNANSSQCKSTESMDSNGNKEKKKTQKNAMDSSFKQIAFYSGHDFCCNHRHLRWKIESICRSFKVINQQRTGSNQLVFVHRLFHRSFHRLFHRAVSNRQQICNILCSTA